MFNSVYHHQQRCKEKKKKRSSKFLIQIFVPIFGNQPLILLSLLRLWLWYQNICGKNKEQKKTKTINGGQTIDADCEPNETDEAIESDYDRDYVQSLKNFDLTEYIKYLNELMVYMYFSKWYIIEIEFFF